MTDNEIIKALECCVAGEPCDKCPLSMPTGRGTCVNSALELIKRQQAEIEELEKCYKLAVAEREANVKGFTEALNTTKTEEMTEGV